MASKIQAFVTVAVIILFGIAALLLILWGFSGDRVISGNVLKTWSQLVTYTTSETVKIGKTFIQIPTVHTRTDYYASVNDKNGVQTIQVGPDIYGALTDGYFCTFHLDNFNIVKNYNCER